MKKNVLQFYEGQAAMKDVLGGKGANLAEMVQLGLPVPPGFTITTSACMDYLNHGQVLSSELQEEVKHGLEKLILQVEKNASSKDNLLLLSVRSGSVFSMPGMMDTILNLGLNDETVEVLAAQTDDTRFALDCYRRLLQMFGEVVYGIDSSRFEQYLAYIKESAGYEGDTELTEGDLREVVRAFKEIYQETIQKDFPQNPEEQLFLAIEAVFRSWNNQRAIVYRNLHDLPHDLGTAVNIQQMVFGNNGETSGTGVAFTRNPSTGEKKIFGEFLMNAQGEDVVAGIRTPQPLESLKEISPAAYEELLATGERLETHYQDMQDIEFTIDHGKLYFLQTRNGKRTAAAAFQVVYDLVQENIISKEEALLRLDPHLIEQLLHPVFSLVSLKAATVIAKGLPASPGAATGKIVFDTTQAKAYVARGEKVILVRQETSPEDVEAMSLSEAIVTSRGGMTSHAAVVARGMGICCVAGSSTLEINEQLRLIRYEGGQLTEGDTISVDGSNGKIYLGEIPVQASQESDVFREIMSWADEAANMKVRANAETPQEIKQAFEFGAVGIGLARTEHMFFEGERLTAMRQLILANSPLARKEALAILLEMQIEDFTKIFEATQTKPVVIRLLDPPLHEFLPHTNQEEKELARQLNLEHGELTQRISDLVETNPMMGHRGCRLGITFPEIYQMQVNALVTSAVAMAAKGVNVKAEIMIPLVGVKAELTRLREILSNNIQQMLQSAESDLEIAIGTMIELPRACLIADQLAESADFFSFGTNDLTQMTYGYSRDDAGKFITHYRQENILAMDPFQRIDTEGVGELMKLAVAKGRQAKPTLKIGVCGEVGGDPTSIAFFQELGLDYVSCSAYRVPLARLAVAQAAISN